MTGRVLFYCALFFFAGVCVAAWFLAPAPGVCFKDETPNIVIQRQDPDRQYRT